MLHHPRKPPDGRFGHRHQHFRPNQHTQLQSSQQSRRPGSGTDRGQEQVGKVEIMLCSTFSKYRRKSEADILVTSLLVPS